MEPTPQKQREANEVLAKSAAIVEDFTARVERIEKAMKVILNPPKGQSMNGRGPE